MGRAWSKNNPDKVAVIKRRYDASEKGKKKNRQWVDKNRSELRRRWNTYRFNKTYTDLGINILALPPKPTVCPLCGDTKRIGLDHSHASGKFRGWICARCNILLGQADDNPVLLRRMADCIIGNECNSTLLRKMADYLDQERS